MANTVFADAEAVVRDWVNSLTAVVGQGRPLVKGATLDRLRGAASVAYVLVSQVGGGEALNQESPIQRAIISGQIFGPSKERARVGADAYADALSSLNGRPVRLTNAGKYGVVDLLFADSISGPLWAPDRSEPRYIVDCTLYLTPVA